MLVSLSSGLIARDPVKRPPSESCDLMETQSLTETSEDGPGEIHVSSESGCSEELGMWVACFYLVVSKAGCIKKSGEFLTCLSDPAKEGWPKCQDE